MNTLSSLFLGLWLGFLIFSQVLEARTPPATLPPLELSHVLKEVHRRHPELQACQAQIAQLESQQAEAGLPENPRLEALGEDFLGNAAVSEQNYMQFTLSLTQNIPLGNRLHLQQEILRLQREAQQHLCLVRQRQLDLEIGRHYLEVLLAEERREQLQYMQKLATGLLQQIDTLIAQGKLTVLERNLPAAELERLVLELRQTEAILNYHRQQLLSYLPESFALERKWIPPKTPTISVLQQQQWLAEHPQRRYQEILLQQARLELALQQAKTLPDLNINGGWRWHPQSHEQGLNLGFALPLQIFNRNQYGIEAAQAQIHQREQELLQLVQNQQRELQGLFARLEQTRQEEQTFTQRILPLSQGYLEKLKQGLQAGKFTVIAVLQAQQQLLRLQQEALNRHQERARLELEVASWQDMF